MKKEIEQEQRYIPYTFDSTDGDLFEGLLDGRKKVEVGAYDGFT